MVVDSLIELLFIKLLKKATIKCQNPITILNHSEPEPDIVIAKYRRDGYRTNHPIPKDIHLVIEVSDATLKKDRTVKYSLYATANIPEYWIINIIDKQIEIHRQPKNGEYHFKQIISQNEIINCSTINFSINYGDLFIA